MKNNRNFQIFHFLLIPAMKLIRKSLLIVITSGVIVLIIIQPDAFKQKVVESKRIFSVINSVVMKIYVVYSPVARVQVRHR